MGPSKVEIVRRTFEAEASRDFASVREFYDPDLEMDWSASPYADFMTQGRHRGLEAIGHAFRDWYAAWENCRTEVHELTESGDHVISVFTYRARGRTSNIEIEHDMAALWTFRDGKLVRVLWLRGRDQAVAAAAES